MEAFAFYLLKSSVWLTGFALVYFLFLRNERFFSLNRIYLLSGILASMLFPLVTFRYSVILPVVPEVSVLSPIPQGIVETQPAFSLSEIALFLFYSFGVFFFAWRMFRQTHSVVQIIQRAEIKTVGSVKLIKSAEYPSSFSFFTYVFVNPSTTDAETEEIVNHEWEHIRQQHWFDLLLTELICMVLWFNPVVWLYGRYIRQNHEYLADEQALQRTANPAIYRAALLNQLFGGPVVSLANSFNYSLNKKRFNMMKKTINSPFRKVKILLVLPIVALLFYAFAKPEYIAPEPVAAEESMVVWAGDEIKGKVVNPDGKPLNGVSVIIAGTTIGTITDQYGEFLLKEVPADKELVLSYVGMKSVRVKPQTGKSMDIQMERENVGLEALTVVGYGPKAPASSDKKSEILSTESANPPLVILDGKVIDKKQMDQLNPETIESISVLKEKSATEVYGEKGKNGVIIITSKKNSASPKPQEPLKSTQTDESGKPIFMVVEEMPEFPGGEQALRNWMAAQVKYPIEAVEKKIQGKVFVNFVVDSNGKVKLAKVVRGVDPSLDKEALRVVNSMPDWKPGKQKGEAVAVSYTTPINFVLTPGTAAEKTTPSSEKPVFIVVEQMPEYPGGNPALMKFLAEQVKYPVVAQQEGIQGRVFVSFVVNKEGKVETPKVVRGVHPALDKEAIRVVNLMPVWTPGKQRGKTVDVAYTLPIEFKLQ